jgi:hypothetical protein
MVLGYGLCVWVGHPHQLAASLQPVGYRGLHLGRRIGRGNDLDHQVRRNSPIALRLPLRRDTTLGNEGGVSSPYRVRILPQLETCLGGVDDAQVVLASMLFDQ